ncbi:hypothetical protein [Rhizobium mulingense]|uniref:Uncharacterized protein n=1 Tax=Rhizobium mulingense TaxID=3031128 RepID=A0ACC6MSH4_9HYPH|nr:MULTISPECIES: hypothetical protein [unclassified Rhizobium]MEA3516325.1 hypothetical protein [Rhizobium sp. MJ31]
MVFSSIWTGFHKANSRLCPDRGGAMAAQALRGLNFRHDFNGADVAGNDPGLQDRSLLVEPFQPPGAGLPI